jgi:pseudouridine-5'-phosphate glycosidase
MLETEIKKLTTAVEALTKAMAPLTADYTVVEAPVEVTVEVAAPVAENAMDKDKLTRMCLDLSRAGHKDSIKAKLESYGVKRVSELLDGKSLETSIAFCDWVTEQVGEIQ